MKPLLILFGLGAAAAWLLASDKAEAKPADKPADKAAPTGGAAPPQVDLLALYAVDTAAKSPAFAEFAKVQPVVAGAVADVAEKAGLPVMWMLAQNDKSFKDAVAAVLKAKGLTPDEFFADRNNIKPLVDAAAKAVQQCMATCGHPPGSAECRTACVAAIGPAVIAAAK